MAPSRSAWRFRNSPHESRIGERGPRTARVHDKDSEGPVFISQESPLASLLVSKPSIHNHCMNRGAWSRHHSRPRRRLESRYRYRPCRRLWVPISRMRSSGPFALGPSSRHATKDFLELPCENSFLLHNHGSVPTSPPAATAVRGRIPAAVRSSKEPSLNLSMMSISCRQIPRAKPVSWLNASFALKS